MLSEYKHENIISLLGFCDDEDQKILVYKYASRQSLDTHLDNKELTWVRRLKICIGAARGSAYLHNPAGGHQRLLHRDIKSPNILLEDDWNALIADFGLSKFGPANQKNTYVITGTSVGTTGYVDAEYMEGVLTKESDVYSFGVVLFEVLCGRLCVVEGQYLIHLVRKHIKHNTLNEIIWCNIKDEIHPDSLTVFSEMAYRCLKRYHESRPNMEEIVRDLETCLKLQEANDPIPSPSNMTLKFDAIKSATNNFAEVETSLKYQAKQIRDRPAFNGILTRTKHDIDFDLRSLLERKVVSANRGRLQALLRFKSSPREAEQKPHLEVERQLMPVKNIGTE